MGKGDGKRSVIWMDKLDEQMPKVAKLRRKLKSKKLEFVGWGSKSLIEFLQSTGKDIGKELSHHNVTSIINDYVHNFGLLHPLKKKRVVSDERLHALFGKKSFPRIKIHELLHSHFADNHDSSEDDELHNSEGYEDGNIKCKKQKVSSLEKKAHSHSKEASETLLSSFAAIIPENIKLLYLKRTLVQELVRQPEIFEEKMLGSYIRIKSDPMDFSQKNSHQLHPVTGVKNVPVNGGLPAEILLQVPNMINEVPIRMLSDDDFSKEEIEDLCQRVKDGLIKRPTVVELEQKTRILHEDITKHWIPRELAYLENLRDRANEKGWRRELFEYLERMKRLQTPSELSKLLTEVPKVTADILEPEPTTPQEHLEDIQQAYDSPVSIHKDVAHPDDELVVLDGFDKGNTEPTKNVGSGEQWVEEKQMPKPRSSGQTVDLPNVIELSDDEEEKEDEDEFSHPKWFYLDPQEQIQGPCSRINLSIWNDEGYFSPDFKVWKDGQTPDNAIFLTDMLSSNPSR